MRILLLLTLLAAVPLFSFSQSNTVDLQPSWLVYHEGNYTSHNLEEVANSVYFPLETGKHASSHLKIESSRPFFLFLNGKLSGEYNGQTNFALDSIFSRMGSSEVMACIYQNNINPRELKTIVVKRNSVKAEVLPELRPASFFKDYVIVSGLIIIIFFLIISQINPKLASDYFSLGKIISPREADDAQSNARLTSSNNFQFYVGCSLLIAFYLMIILNNLPPEYALPLKFRATSFWMLMWQWLKLSTMILLTFLIKIVIVFMLTRLFNMRGLARVHFFNWIRLLLIVFGVATIILFSYYILRGQSEAFFVTFLSLVIATLIGWIFIVFMKLNGKTEHSMFHLFSYICATELIPLLITIKVLFQ